MRWTWLIKPDLVHLGEGENMLDSPILRTIAISLIMTSILFLQGCSNLSSEVTVYGLKCPGTVANDRCDKKLERFSRTTFKASESRQDVMYWSPGIIEVPTRLPQCVVRNSKTWSCWDNEHSAQLVMVGGKFGFLGEWAKTTNIIYVPSWQWWIAKWSSSHSHGTTHFEPLGFETTDNVDYFFHPNLGIVPNIAMRGSE